MECHLATFDGRASRRSRPTSTCATSPSCFRALASLIASLIAERRRGLDKRRLQFHMERLVADVKAAYDEYPVEKIETMWAYKIDIMQKVIDCNGGNCYDRRRRKWCDGEGSQSQE